MPKKLTFEELEQLKQLLKMQAEKLKRDIIRMVNKKEHNQ